jgi:hypothetical protein
VEPATATESPAEPKTAAPTSPSPAGEMAGSQVQSKPPDTTTTGRKKRHVTTRRNIEAESSSTKRPNPFDKSGGKQGTNLRPNPF